MGGAVSSGRNNDELIDNLMSGNYIRSSKVEEVFRALDRAEYMTPEAREQAYQDLAWRNGPLHLSSPCIYSEVMEGLELKPGLSFLNVGSGTGYLSTMAGLILGTAGISHGVEVHPAVVEYAMEKMTSLFENSPILDEFDFCEPKFYTGNGLCLDTPMCGYDRVYCGAGCPDEYENYFKRLIKVGGILVMPLNDTLLQIRRVGVDKWKSRSLLNVSFATLRVPTAEEAASRLELDKQTPARLQWLARAAVRAALRRGVTQRHPEVREAPRVPLPPACPRRICIPIDPLEAAVEGLNVLHDLDNENGANEMNALLSLVINMGQNRVAGALRFDRVTPSDSEDDDSDDQERSGHPDSDHRGNRNRGSEHRDNRNRGSEHRDNRNRSSEHRDNRNRGSDHRDNRNVGSEHQNNHNRDNDHQDNHNRGCEHRDNRNRGSDHRDNRNRGSDHRDNRNVGSEHQDNHNRDNDHQDNHNRNNDSQDNHNRSNDRKDKHKRSNDRQDNHNRDNNHHDNHTRDNDRQDNHNRDNDHQDNHNRDNDHQDNRNPKEKSSPDNADFSNSRSDEMTNPTPKSENGRHRAVWDIFTSDSDFDSDSDEEYVSNKFDTSSKNAFLKSRNTNTTTGTSRHGDISDNAGVSRPDKTSNTSDKSKHDDHSKNNNDSKSGDPSNNIIGADASRPGNLNNTTNTSTPGNVMTLLGNTTVPVQPNANHDNDSTCNDGPRPRSSSTDENISSVSRKSGRIRLLYSKSQYAEDVRPSTSCECSTDKTKPADTTSGEASDNVASQDPVGAPSRPNWFALSGVLSEVEINLGKMETADGSEDDTDTSKSKPKRQKLDSGIGENTPSGSSPEKSKSETSDSERLLTISPTDEADLALEEERRDSSFDTYNSHLSESAIESDSSREDFEGFIAAASRAGGARDAGSPPPQSRGARLSCLMKQAVSELPLPPALRKFVNLGRC